MVNTLGCLPNTLVAAGARALLSMCIPYSAPTYFFVIPSSPMNVNVKQNPLLVIIPAQEGIQLMGFWGKPAI